jgi:hypothetical protein
VAARRLWVKTSTSLMPPKKSSSFLNLGKSILVWGKVFFL